MPTSVAHEQTISKKVGLAVFASDALSSTAYATDEILIVLAMAGTGVTLLGLSLPIAVAIVVLLGLVTVSYLQTIHAYPNGGGAYIVARDNLGEGLAQAAGAALLVDYVLTVAVSISSGVAQITSAFKELEPYRVEIAVAFIIAMTIVNLRGVKEAGTAFAIPTYFFLAVTVTTIVIGYVRHFSGDLGVVTAVDPMHAEVTQALGVFLILRAFSSGCTALTGVEAISNGITAFHEPRSRNAAQTLVTMSLILSVIFLSITFLANQIQAAPSHTETIFSQLGRTIYGDGTWPYLTLLGATTLILIMAANTAYAGFPRLAALMATDGYLPKQLTYRGSRLGYSYGIIALAGLAALLVVVFNATTTNLIPLYAIGVFMSFTLAQIGMSIRWWRSGRLKPGEAFQQHGNALHYERDWRQRLAVNAVGAVVCFVVMCIFAITKFSDGAWIVVVVIPVLIALFFRIHHHYRDTARDLSLDTFGLPGQMTRHKVIVAIGDVHRGSLRALQYGRSLSPDVTAVHVAVDPEGETRLRKRWETYGDGTRLVVLASPFRELLEPLTAYIRQVAAHRRPSELMTVIVPEFVPAKAWQYLLHMNTAFFLRIALLGLEDVVITEVPYQLRG